MPAKGAFSLLCIAKLTFIRPFNIVLSSQVAALLSLMKKNSRAYYMCICLCLVWYTFFFFCLFSSQTFRAFQFRMADIFLVIVLAASTAQSLPSLLGLLTFGSPELQDQKLLENLNTRGWPTKCKVIFCYVSVGKNRDTLQRSIEETQRVLKKYSVLYEIEIVTEIDVSSCFQNSSAHHFLVVPSGYQTQNISAYKARALQYAIEQRLKRYRADELDKIWVFHSDEETTLTDSCVGGLGEFVGDQANLKSCGAGEILYNLRTSEVPFLIYAADCQRTGDDLGRFRFQYKIFQAPVFGMHGSFLVVPASIERDYGFDFGAKGSITEDAYFGFISSTHGVPFKWISGHVREQSPTTFYDFLKQRSRWIIGLLFLCREPKVSLKKRIFLFSYLFFWRITVLGFTLVNLILAFRPSSIYIFLCLMIWGIMSSVALIGALRNKKEDCHPLTISIVFHMVLVVLLLPISCLMETVALLYALLRPSYGFYVIKKY